MGSKTEPLGDRLRAALTDLARACGVEDWDKARRVMAEIDGMLPGRRRPWDDTAKPS